MNQTVQKYLVYVLLAAVTGFGVYAAKPDILNPSVVITDPNSPVQIAAPSSARIGQLVKLDVKSEVANGYSWRVLPPTDNFYVIDDGNSAVFSAESPSEYTFVVAGVCDGVSCLNTHRLTIQDDGLDDGLTAKIMAWLKTITPQEEDSRRRLGDSFRKIAELIRNGDLGDDPRNFIRETLERTRAALGDHAPQWRPFFQNLSEELNQRAINGTLVTPQDHANLWTEIGDALSRR